MKKTLTILLSLVGVTVAEANIVQELFTLTDAAQTEKLNIPGEEADVVDNSWTFVLTLNPSELGGLTGSSYEELFNLTFDSDESTGVGYFPAYRNLLAEFVATTSGYTNGYLSGSGDTLDFSWDEVTGAGLTFVITTNAKNELQASLYHHFVLTDGTHITNQLEGINEYAHNIKIAPTTLGSVSMSKVGVQSVTCYYGSANEDEATELAKLAATGVVPEPTTATLSLLTLAGLAARRRRK